MLIMPMSCSTPNISNHACSSSYCVCWQGENHDISNLKLRCDGASLYPPMETTLKVISRFNTCSDALLPMWSLDHYPRKTRQVNQGQGEHPSEKVGKCQHSEAKPAKIPPIQSASTASSGHDQVLPKRTHPISEKSSSDGRRRSFITVEVRTDGLRDSYSNSSKDDPAHGSSQAQQGPARSTSGTRSTLPDTKPKKNAAITRVQIEVSEEGYPLMDIGGGLLVPYIGTRERTRKALQVDCLDCSSRSSSTPSTIVAECSVCQANLICLHGMSCVMCMSCTTISPVSYDRADLLQRDGQQLKPHGLGVGLSLDRMVL
ncbi:expressed unknown protein [Seminavis robusta]|uniref:Uncharacterized protein n=1 Tax=Seminavis robusta TaxID=568900 RepID=A0A9N8ERX2_9STRA|nr:expressed unknown protein [Seminavis robusta]|eukprot:Sro1706_g292490.1 n/a (316) ;mRNA; f:3118-4065